MRKKQKEVIASREQRKKIRQKHLMRTIRKAGVTMPKT